jgi:hypothetical protein
VGYRRRVTEEANPVLPDVALAAGASAMVDEVATDDEGPRRRTDRFDLAAAILLAAATVLAAWAAYQATRWSGVQASAYNQSVIKRTDAAQLASVFAAETLIDVEMWLSWMQQVAAEDVAAAAVVQERMRDEFRPAFDAWLAQVPSGGIPPGTPFERDEYLSTTELTVISLNDEADALAAEAHEANRISDDFVLMAVIMALVLFFAGVATRFGDRRIRIAMLGLAVALLVGGLAFTLSMPQNVPF